MWGCRAKKQRNKQKRSTQLSFLEISEAVIRQEIARLYTGQGFISVHTEDPKLGPVSEINSVINIKLH